ncbi:MAG TPA: DUF4157 domain-containing protein [Nitrospiraceae bacterium]|nr:DUF4157 domain-containing protein [Nitrospiraceae bacterium]
MNREAVMKRASPNGAFTPAPVRAHLQRKCACGKSAGVGGPCGDCQRNKLVGKPIQTKLQINEPGDVYEQEADRVAEQVMRMPEHESEPTTGRTELIQRRVDNASIARMPMLQRAEDSTEVPAAEGDKPKEEGSSCPSWRGDPQSISKRAGEFYARNHLTPPSQATVERIDCEPPNWLGNYGCYVHFSDGLVLRVIVRETDIVVGTGPGPITTEHPPPATPLCFYEYACPEGDLVLTVKKCQSAKPSGSSGPPAVAQRAAASGAPGPMAAPPIVHDVLSSRGRPLDPATRAFFEPRLGHDFSRVRVHTGGIAEQSARRLNAHAYTVGHDIVFGPGQYAPQTAAGRRLLAHELVHVAQQGESCTRSLIQRRLIATGDKADVKVMLRLLESASGLILKHGAKKEISITGLADKHPSFELANRLWTIIDDPKQDAEIHLGRKQPNVLFGAFPPDLTKPVQEIRIDHILALEKGAPGSGVAKLAHEIVENYEAHALTGYNWSVALGASHEKAEMTEDLIEGELGHPGAGRTMFPVFVKAGKGKDGFTRWVEDRENYFLVWDQSDTTLSNARRVPRVNVSTYTIEGWTAASDTLPDDARASIAALTADMKNNPTASALVQGFASIGGSRGDQIRLADQWTEMVQDKVIELTGDVLITNWRRFHRVSIPALTRNSVVITLDRPDL